MTEIKKVEYLFKPTIKDIIQEFGKFVYKLLKNVWLLEK